jgi:HlyD family secretion protein
MKNLLIIACVLGLIGCYSQKGDADAYGTFEATELTISAEVPGKILKLETEEGKIFGAGTVV